MSASSSNIPVGGLVLQEKANDLTKKLDIAYFKASKDGLTVGRQEILLNLKQYQMRENNAHQK